jgi:hypothetical protein
MRPVERGSGQLFHCNRYLCNIDYEIGYPLGFANVFNIRHIRFAVEGIDPATLLSLSDLIAIATDGTQHPLTQPLELRDDGRLECALNSPT